eukprot:GHUV01032186.1.p1 GENE.GHUV01032186.1~~GHUV01032186.1.p1  ORF type:complete len:410 (+),score=137.08 GHUV01032186.1:330-1559(+)
MTKHSDVIELMSPEHDLPNELVINLASPQRPGEMCNQDGVQVDSNNLLAQLPTQSGSQDAQDYQQVDALRVARKRMWGEMDGAEQQQRVAGHMQWGSTGPRMQRSRTAVLQAAQVDRQASGGSDDAVAATPVPHQSATHAGRRRLTIVPRKQQLQAAAAGAESPAIVIDDDSPVPTRQQQRISSGVGSRPAPIAIRGNPGYASRVAAAAAAAPATQRPRRRMRANVVWDLAAQVGPAARGAARASREEHGGSSSDDAEIARRVQEEEDADMARRMMQEEQMRAQTEAAERHRRRMELMRQIEAEEAAAEAATAAAMAAAAAAQAGSPGRARGRRGGRAPQRAEHHQQQHEAHQQPHQHNPHWGMAMAHALLQLPRWGGGRGRGLPPGLSAMREAVTETLVQMTMTCCCV